MGVDRRSGAQRKPFTQEDVANKGLVLRMLQHEDQLMVGPVGSTIFKDPTIPHLTDLETYYIFHRQVLADHGFSSTDEDVANYRSIFQAYYRGPTDYDGEVLSSVCYMRENKCVYYTAPSIDVDDAAPDVELATLGGESTSLHAVLAKHSKARHIFVGAFSNS